jgi:mannosyltransferase OCH1-like enzyme
MQRLIAANYDFRLAANRVVPPKFLVQFWDDANTIPPDVRECIDSWAALENLGFQRLLFDDASAEDFVESHLDSRHLRAFQSCRHPAMRSDYFRLCFMLVVGGFYVDADDVYLDQPILDLFSDSNLKMQPLCYDVANDAMLDPATSASTDAENERIFYVNNNPLIAPARHPIIADALERATTSVLSENANVQDIQALTGPGNLTACLVKRALDLEREGVPNDFVLLTEWESIARSQWPLEYRADDRNWRRWVRSNG